MPSPRRRSRNRRERSDLTHLSLILQTYYAPAPPSAPCASEDEYGAVVGAVWDLGCDSPRPELDYERHPYINRWCAWLDAYRASTYPRSVAVSPVSGKALPDADGAAAIED